MPRIAAWKVLRSGSTTPLRQVPFEAARRELDARDEGLLRSLVGTEVRRRGTLRALVRKLARGKPKPDLVAHLHVGFVQLFFLDRVPDHAAVSETVDAVARTLGHSKGSYANAVMRAAIALRRSGTCGDPRRDLPGRELCFAEPVFRDPETHPLLWAEDALSIPAALMKRWVRRWGSERAQALARAFLEEPPLSLRVVRGDRDEHLRELAAAGCDPRPAGHPDVILCPPGDVRAATHGAAFAEGRLTVQGETALRCAELVGAAPGERVLDLCAAPGGKTAVLAGAGAEVVACDRSPAGLVRLRQTVDRLGLAERVRAVATDAGRGLRGTAAFDAVLVDAPCSNTGLLSARPAARWRFGPQSMRSLAELQERLLAAAAPRVRPGGRLVWSTCSIEPEENAARVRAFLERHAGWELEEEVEGLPGAGPEAPGDGGWAARLRRPSA